MSHRWNATQVLNLTSGRAHARMNEATTTANVAYTPRTIGGPGALLRNPWDIPSINGLPPEYLAWYGMNPSNLGPVDTAMRQIHSKCPCGGGHDKPCACK